MSHVNPYDILIFTADMCHDIIMIIIHHEVNHYDTMLVIICNYDSTHMSIHMYSVNSL